MLVKIAWLNIWRNRRRSLIVLSSMVIGVMAIILTDTLSIGMMQQILDNQIGSHASHLQIHKQGFNDNKLIQNVVPNPSRVETLLRERHEIKHFSRRLVTFGLVSSASNSGGVLMVGVEAEKEPEITKVRSSLIAGNYLSGEPNQIVIGQKLAEKLDVSVGDKVVGMASSADGRVGSDAFRIVGIYRTFSSTFDQTTVFITLQNGQEMLGIGNDFSEFAMILADPDGLPELDQILTAALGPDYEVLTFPELLPLAVMQIDIYKESMVIFYAIIGLALIFGIINTLLMSVFERMHEFGVLMAIGLKNGKLFIMVILEALLLGLLGTAMGFSCGIALHYYLAHVGIDLSLFSDGLMAFGSGSVIYPVLTPEGIVGALLVIPFFAVLGALYPAIKAARLDPIHAIKYV